MIGVISVNATVMTGVCGRGPVHRLDEDVCTASTVNRRASLRPWASPVIWRSSVRRPGPRRAPRSTSWAAPAPTVCAPLWGFCKSRGRCSSGSPCAWWCRRSWSPGASAGTLAASWGTSPKTRRQWDTAPAPPKPQRASWPAGRTSGTPRRPRKGDMAYRIALWECSICSVGFGWGSPWWWYPLRTGWSLCAPPFWSRRTPGGCACWRIHHHLL